MANTGRWNLGTKTYHWWRVVERTGDAVKGKAKRPEKLRGRKVKDAAKQLKATRKQLITEAKRQRGRRLTGVEMAGLCQALRAQV